MKTTWADFTLFAYYTAFWLYVLAQGYHALNEMTKDTLQGHSVFLKFLYGKKL